MFLLILLPLVAIAKPVGEKELHIELPNIKVYAFEEVLDRWGSEYWDSFDKIVVRESNWVHTAQNPDSTAYGLCQFLDSTFEAYGGKTEDPYKQIDKCIEYIKDRYENPKNALSFHLKNSWY